MFRSLMWALFAVVFLFGLAGLAYDLPRSEKVRITNTDIKRSDKRLKDGTTKTNDVRYVYAETIDDGTALAFRNEDTGFSWPPYFKFDSGDITAAASKWMAEDPHPIVLVTYYGVRSNILSVYPNILSIKKVSADYERTPLLNVLVYIAYIALFIFLAVLYRRLLAWRPFHRGDDEDLDADPADLD